MFGSRRKRGLSNPTLNASNANPNATSAAAQAFLRNQASNASLASAAAGAALRSRPTTPTAVAEVQTKRMLRRAGSTSSMGSSTTGSVRGPPGFALERRGSNGSMTERTFRESSPSPHVPSASDAPPVPALPKTIPVPSSHRRTASLETPPSRIASPPPNMNNGRGSSLGPRNIATPPRRPGHRTSQSIIEEQESPKSQTRGSVNYSLPTGIRVESPFDQRRLTSPSPYRLPQPRITSQDDQSLVYDANTRSFLPLTEIIAIEQRIQDAAHRPVKKKKRVAPAQYTGSHFAEGTMGRPHGTAVDAIEKRSSNAVELPAHAVGSSSGPGPEPEPAPVTTPSKKQNKKAAVSEIESDQDSHITSSTVNGGQYNTRVGALLAKKPSIVREDREREEKEDDTPTRKRLSESNSRFDVEGTRTHSPIPRPRSSAEGKGKAAASAAYAQERQQTRSAGQPAPQIEPTDAASNGATSTASGRGSRVQSVSPGRTTHFGPSPDNLSVKHHPPGRSVSPRKSALKYPGQDRGSSPGGDLSGNELQNGSVNGSDDSPLPRKKQVRVSFDESKVIVGEAAGTIATDSPVAPSPQVAKRTWFGLGARGKKSDATFREEEEDEVMKPRPALPSFGSVRGRSVREQAEERQLVKPTDYSAPVERDAASPTGETSEASIGQSKDHIVGAILSQDAASKNEANISKSREPLPPQVLSVEGNGYHSDTDSTVSALEYADQTPQTSSTDAPEVSEISQPRAKEEMSEDIVPSTPKQTNGNVPQISFTQPTPVLEQKEWMTMPGGFPETNSDSGSIAELVDTTSHADAEPTTLFATPALVGIAEPYEGQQPGLPGVGEVHSVLETSLQHSSIAEETEDSDTISIYSDAAEDLSDLEGDGFLSLDAVVDSPVTASPPLGLAISSPPASPTADFVKERAFEKSGLSEKAREPEHDQGWSKAQEYWSGLSADKKRRLEQEARDEDADSDSTIEAQPPPPKRKTKKKVAAVAPPVQLVEKPVPYKHERTYMIQPGAKMSKDGYTPTMKSSMRAEPSSVSPDNHIRKSMRSQPQGPVNGSLRASERVEPRQTQRPTSLPANQIRADPAAVRMHIKALSVAGASVASTGGNNNTALPTTLRRRGSDDSDSSFKRARPAEVTTFRRSMRNNADQPVGKRRQSPPAASGRFSIRSMSPASSVAGRQSINGGTQMRSSMRNSQPSPSVRNSKSERTKSPIRFPGFGRQSSKPVPQKPAPVTASRFNDSSDEEEARPAFQSRFVDSSDDDDDSPHVVKQSGMRSSMRANQPVLSTPSRIVADEGDSSELPDSDDEKTPVSAGKLSKARPTGKSSSEAPPIRRLGSGREAMPPATVTTNITSPDRPNHNRRGSFMSMLRGKKADPVSKVRKSDAESPARRDTPLERSRSDLAAMKRNGSYNPTNGAVPSPKLQKRTNSGSWPLAAQPLGDEKEIIERPFTADAANGVVGGEDRPNMIIRRSTATGAVDVNGTLETPKKKKKKFHALRKMFKLDE